MLANNNQILELIPQKPPMIMVDALVENDSMQSTSIFRIKKTNMFCKSGFYQEAGIVENIAQTAALRSGYAAKLQGETPKTGFIGSVKKLIIYELPKEEDTIHTTIFQLHELLNATVVKGEVRVNNKLIAEAEMNIFLQDET